ncbi:IclR family transcriptional regulator [Natrinema versiforme]|uniref:IclR family transcriptional regulator n=1 Tax=Natrinema versiforme TaxID=88724 RepID=A0A4P8WMW0_9EURY|nr:IclR family transcriptional regulator [Natrinema versiforme]QCS44938.1 IclR family transcriptional regulator [Natrinema versiforme]
MGRNTGNNPNRIGAVKNLFEVVEGMEEFGGCGVRELADYIDVPKSTVHIYLKSLEDAGYVVQRDGQYQLSLRFLQVGGQVRHNNGLYQVGRNEIDELAQETGEVATIGCEECGYRVMLYRTEPIGAIFNNAPTGEYTRMHWTALGKAMLSQQSDERIGEIIEEHGLPQATEHTIVDRDALQDEIETVREQGYAIEDEERVNGVRSVAVPVSSEGVTADAAISVAGPKHDFDEDRIENELVPELQNTANVIELKTKHY